MTANQPQVIEPRRRQGREGKSLMKEIDLRVGKDEAERWSTVLATDLHGYTRILHDLSFFQPGAKVISRKVRKGRKGNLIPKE